MARIKVATSSDLQEVQTQVTNIDNAINQPAGLDERVAGTESEIVNINDTIGATDAAGLRKRIADNETAIGDANSGLTKGQNDLVSVVGADNTQGLQGRVGELETTVDTASTGLADRVVVAENTLDELKLKPVATWDVDSDTAENSNISVSGNEFSYFLGGMTADTTNNNVTVPVDGLYRVSLHSIVYMANLTLNQSLSVEVRVNDVRVHQFRVYANTDLSYMIMGGTVTVPANANETIAFATRGSTVLYGSNGDYTSCAIEYVRPLSD